MKRAKRPAYYNEVEKGLAKWLRNLMDARLIPAGEVDTRSIADVEPADLAGFGQCHFFAGLGGWALAFRLAGVHDDCDVWSGSPPCQPFSVAGLRRGFADERHLAPQFLRLIRARKPAKVFGEQVASADGRDWFAALRAEMEAMGYEVGGADLCAAGIGAPHPRQRICWGADAIGDEQPRKEPRCWAPGRVGRIEQPVSWNARCLDALPEFRALDHGLPRNVGATDAARNAIVPGLGAEFIAAFEEAREMRALARAA